ncbi:MAG: hypothetical protein ABIU06_16810 [Anaerolineales bacterium]
MSITAKLKVILLVDDAKIAESEDPKLWQAVFGAIRKESLPEGSSFEQYAFEDLLQEREETKISADIKEPIPSFAQKIGTSIELFQGACSPSLEPPYIHLDKHHWEALKKSATIAHIVISATILAVWKEHIKAPPATRKEAKIVLKTISLEDKSIPRGLGNCKWLQVRGDNIQINPAYTSRAIELVRAYCEKETPRFIKQSK